MRQLQWIALATLVALALGIGYFLGRGAPSNAPHAAAPEPASHVREAGAAAVAPNTGKSSRVAHALPNSSLPPAGTPLKQEAAELQARADAGDAQAASRLFHDTQTCYEVRKVKTSAPDFAKWALERKPDGATPEALQRADHMLESVQKQLDYERDNTALCNDLSDQDINAVLPRALHAAQLGDALAAECYLGARLSDMPGLIDNPEWLYDYKLNAPALIDAGLARGDWAVVMQVVRALHPGASGYSSLLGQLLGQDPVQYYRYLKLMSLGAVPGDPAQDEVHRQQLADAAGALDANALRDADAWAQDIYQRGFQEMPPFTAENNPFTACHPGMQVEFR